MTNEINNTADMLDLRDVIARVEELREELTNSDDGAGNAEWADSEKEAELAALEALLDECKGAGGDEQWEGDWYSVTLVRDSYFEDYAQELAEDVCSDAVANASWPLTCIDWEKAARELRMDYAAVDFDGVAYWTR